MGDLYVDVAAEPKRAAVPDEHVAILVYGIGDQRFESHYVVVVTHRHPPLRF
jgi:hypothetical protein